MCGITGIWTTDLATLQQQVAKAVAALHHRGPDDHGIWVNGHGVALGHTRLSILDLSTLGHQPMISGDGRYAIVFNGEIYNFADIRERLIARGHRFQGSGDTEVVLHALSDWGPKAVDQFFGMFAIAWWDEHAKRLLLIRDRVGVKPLYYGWHGSTFCFSSELKALREYTHWVPEIDQTALGEFLQYGYVSGDRTIYNGIRKLPPGHFLTLQEGGTPRIESYWNVTDAVGARTFDNDADAEAQLEALLIDSFRLRMVSDVPVGVYLSGGIDSSLVTSLLAANHDSQIHTYTIGFDVGSHDESHWAREVARHCGTKHTEYLLGINEALAIARTWGDLFDEPFGDSSGIPTLLVSRLASKKVKVVLSADGGDELFSGYDAYNSVLERMRTLDRLPGNLGRYLASLITALPDGALALAGTKNHRRVRNLASMLQQPTVGNVLDIRLSQLFPDEVRQLIGSYDNPRRSASSYPGDSALQMSLWDFANYLPEDILTKVDRTTMAASIEGREPLLDHRLIEFAMNLPLHLRRGALGSKHILKSILYRHVPRALVDRPKQGFSIPLRAWLKNELRDLVREYLAPSRIESAGLMDSGLVKQFVDDFYNEKSDCHTAIWLLLSFEMWRERWM